VSIQVLTYGCHTSLAAWAIVGAVEAIVAISFAAFVFAGYLEAFMADGIGLYLGAAAVVLAGFAWLAGTRGVIGGMHGAAAAVVAIVVADAALGSFGRPERDFLTAVAATLVVTVLCGVVLLVLGVRRLANVIRLVPYPVVGGLLAGAGWLLLKGGIYVASGESPYIAPLTELLDREALIRWLPALAFGVVLLLVVRIAKHPLAFPAGIGVGLLAFAIGMLLTGSSLETARAGGWLLGPLDDTLWRSWTFRAVAEADWLAVLGQWAALLTAVFVAAIATLSNVSGTEVVLDRDLDTDREVRDAGSVNVVSGALGGIPGCHALGSTELAERMRADARAAGLVAAVVPAAASVFGVAVVELIPRMILGGVLLFLGATFIVEWVWDKRRVLQPLEYVVVLAILGTIVARGFLPGVVLGLVLAVVMFAISYGKVELVREAHFGDTYRSTVDRSPTQRAELRSLEDQVQIMRVSGFLFFGSTDRLLDRVRERVAAAPPRFLLIDLRRVTGVDSSAVASFGKVLRLAATHGFQIVLTGASGPVRAQLERGGVREDETVRYEPDLDRGLQWCEDALLVGAGGAEVEVTDDRASLDGLPPGVSPYLERISVPAGSVLIRQDEPPGDVYVLGSGRLVVETLTPAGTVVRLRTLRSGAVVGEMALYTGVPRTADVVAEAPSVVLRLSAGSIERMEASEPEVAAALHRWLATTLADRLHETQGTFETLLG